MPLAHQKFLQVFLFLFICTAVNPPVRAESLVISKFLVTKESAKRACHEFTAQYGLPGDTYCVSGAPYSPENPISGLYSAGNFFGNDGNTYLGNFGFCPAETIYTGSKCVYFTVEPTEAPKAQGPAACSVGEPINPGNGNMWHVEHDYASVAPGHLAITRTYNSSLYRLENPDVRGFGSRWTQPYDVTVRPSAPVAKNQSDLTCGRRYDNAEVVCTLVAEAAVAGVPSGASVSRGDGKRMLFNREGGLWVSANDDVTDQLLATLNSTNSAVVGWTYKTAAGTTEKFDGSGQLLDITAADGTRQRLTYSNGVTNDSSVGRYPADAPVCANVQAGAPLPAGKLLCVSDDWGRQLQFEYDIKGRIAKVIDPANEATEYLYDGVSGGCEDGLGDNAAACAADNLTSIVFADGKRRIYHYNEASRINKGASCPGTIPTGPGFGHLHRSLTGYTDENEVRFINWTYDCSGKATSSELAEGVEKVEIKYGQLYYGLTETTVTHTAGTPAAPLTTTSRFFYGDTVGQQKPQIVPERCPECGPVSVIAYDANGNHSSMTYRNGSKTTFVYDLPRNLETSRVEAADTPLARTITTQWHANLRVPVAIAEPKRITRYGYDGKGNVLTKTVQATSDQSGAQGMSASPVGAALTWTQTYNTRSQLLSSKGPRTDVVDMTTYEYDENVGLLSSVTNALGHKTLFSDYDAHGRARRIVAPNGVVTERVFTSRGWLASTVVRAGVVTRKTDYEYDGVGQLKKIYLADGTVLSYGYDDAHRLTDIADSLGNTVSYELDFLGNRVSERIRDPQGTLKRQVTREFNVYNQIVKQTGAAQ